MLRLGNKIRLTQSEFEELCYLVSDTPVVLYRPPVSVDEYNTVLQKAADYWKNVVADDEAKIVAGVIEETKINSDLFAAPLMTG
ncbi:MAG: hypothetical protein K0U68_01580 [Gammaproteobacteria bacterium]|nr:hypothetical protein [Gammaproteobacteria bacterium]